MRGATASWLSVKMTASFRNGSMRWNGIEGNASASSDVPRARGDSLSVSPPTGWATRSRARPPDFSRNSIWPGKMRCGLRISSRFMPHSSGQRHGDLRYMLEMAHNVSPRFTVYESGALGASSESATPASATCCAVLRCWPVMGKLGSAAKALPASAAPNMDTAARRTARRAWGTERVRLIG